MKCWRSSATSWDTFIGEDTRMTREFYPLRFKIRATMVAMARSGWVGWPSFQFLNFFTWCFGETEHAASRKRELLADEKAAALTSPRTAASALVRFQVATEAFRRGLADAIKNKIENPLNVPLQAIVQEKLAADTEFWHQLFEQKLPHPLDSHPSLHVRLEALGQNFSVEDARNIALAESKSAYVKWFSTHEALFDNLAKQAQTAMGKMRLAQGNIETQPLISAFQSKMAFYGTVVMLAVIGMIPIMLLGLFVQFHFAGPNFQLPRFLILPILLAAATPGFLVGLWFARKQLKKQFWRLTDTELSCGISHPQSFPLADIEKIIVGLPVDTLGKMFQRAKPGTVAGALVAVLSTVDPRWNMVKALHLARAKKENSLLICFKDSSCLPLRLYLFPNGTAIMDALKELFKDRLIQDYNYSAEEVRRLRRCDVNELIPPPKQPKKCHE